jgi:hypothetical protein
VTGVLNADLVLTGNDLPDGTKAAVTGASYVHLP